MNKVQPESLQTTRPTLRVGGGPRSCPSSRVGYAQALERRAERRRKARDRYLKRNWATNIVIDESWFRDEDYDTDLESEFTDHRKSYSPEELYREICEKLHVIPSHYFLRNFDEPVMRIPFQMLGPKGVQALMVPLQLNHSVSILDLTGNFMGGSGVRHLMKLLVENHFISELILTSNKLGNSGAKAVHAGLKNNLSIKHLDVSNNGFDCKGAEYFAELMMNNTTIKEMNLSNNNFCDKGGEILAKGLQNNDSLLKLDLSWNHLRLSGAEHVAKALKFNRDLEILNLSMNGFSNPGAKVLATALLANKCLLHLDISNNRISMEGCQSLSKVLEKVTPLKELMLGLNPLTNNGVKELLKAISKNRSCNLDLLDLTGLVIDQETNDIAEHVIEERAPFTFNIGNVLKQMDQSQLKPLQPKSELQILVEFMSVNNLRLVDVFQHSRDSNNTGIVTRDEFISSIENLGTTLSRKQIGKLAANLAEGKEGQINVMKISQSSTEPSNYGEIIESEDEDEKDRIDE